MDSAGFLGIQLLCALGASPCLGLGLHGGVDATTARGPASIVDVAPIVGGQARIEWWSRRGVAVRVDARLGAGRVSLPGPGFVPDVSLVGLVGYRVHTSGAHGLHVGGQFAKDLGPCLFTNCAYGPTGVSWFLDAGVVFDGEGVGDAATGFAFVVPPRRSDG